MTQPSEPYERPMTDLYDLVFDHYARNGNILHFEERAIGALAQHIIRCSSKRVDALLDLTLGSYSQWAEDIVLHKLLHPVERGFYIDVGCSDHTHYSVTKFFYERGWRGINIDPNPQLMAAYEKARPDDVNLCLAVSSQEREADLWLNTENSDLTTLNEKFAEYNGIEHYVKNKVSCKSLNTIIAEYFPEGAIHFLKIDVESHEKAVLTGLNLSRFRPWVIVCELHDQPNKATTAPAWLSIYSEAYDGLLETLKDSGYIFFSAHKGNTWFIADEIKDELLVNFVAKPAVTFIKAHHRELLQSFKHHLVLFD